ncbi:MAG: zinc-binding dehydrogenase [Candidatus Nitrohelix vancouverensis]|uniref:Zinc-binding dehydrogenase n=1 Tax=Candidatus Nitrohelix vancouverensis TaxID=2705534 RepID=A0A7T0C3J3_9BACT|nr:MAG: zinc-binding dehydrogenase [Candidatus Nitrohelix vancouverensis]
MRALVIDIQRKEWEATRGMRFRDVSAPELNESKDALDDGRVLIRPLYTGFCGSDKGIWFRHAFKEMIFDSLDAEKAAGDPTADYRICGHELLGEIQEVGSFASQRYGYKAGDIVSTESHIFCGICHQCKIGDAHVCTNHKIIGISMDGCFAEQIKLPAKELWPTDLNKIRPEVAAIQEPLGNAVHACSRVDLRGKTVAIFGCGTIGLFALLVARAMGATTLIGVDVNKNNLALADRLGVDALFHVDNSVTPENKYSADAEIAESIKKICLGDGVDVAFEMSGSNQALNNAIESTRAGGDVILFGLSAGDFVIPNFQNIIMNGITLHSIVGRKVFQTWYIMSNLLASKEHQLQDKIYRHILNEGRDVILPFHETDADELEATIKKHPKIILKYS